MERSRGWCRLARLGLELLLGEEEGDDGCVDGMLKEVRQRTDQQEARAVFGPKRGSDDQRAREGSSQASSESQLRGHDVEWDEQKRRAEVSHSGRDEDIGALSFLEVEALVCAVVARDGRH